MADSYDDRIMSALREKASAETERDLLYPGSPEWEDANAKVREWERTVEDLRRADAGA